MAPISEKRSPTPHTKENAKENASKTHNTTNNTSNNKKTLEIQDFHESWLRDIESYKNQVRIQQMLTTHNHVHTPDGCATDTANAVLATSGGKRRSPPPRQNGNSIVDYEGRPRGEEITSSTTPTPTAITLSQSASNAKRHQNNNNNNNMPQNHHQNQLNPSQESSPSATAKIIVNSFHASSLLNSNKNNGDLTARLLPNTTTTTNSSASSDRLTTTHHHQKPKINKLLGPPKEDEDGFERLKLILSRPLGSYIEPLTIPDESKGDSPTPDDDTCSHPNVYDDDNTSLDADDIGDIDDLNVFEESDDDAEDYVGCPFVLDSDADIKFMSEAVTVTKPNPKSVLQPSLFPQVAPYITFSSHLEKGPAVPTTLHKIMKWRLSPVMPRVVRRVIFNSGFRLIKRTTDWMAVWEKHMRSPGFKTIRSHQKFNHMPGSFRIGRKDSMWKNLRSNMTKHGKSEFGFMQKTYILPDEVDALKKIWPRAAAQSTKWIVKPPASARGTGISVVNKWSQIPKDKPVVVQKYIEKPLLINENKFDLRLYVLVTSINPLRIYMYKNGLARFASVKYSSDLESLNDRCMHLTNYSINKLSENYAKNEDINACQGHKWTLQSLWSYLEKRKVDTKRLWATLRNLAIKSLISGEGCLNRMYRQNVNSRYNCYELFGFDVLLDEDLVPWLLEINISPSLHSELPLDLHVKGPLIQSVLNTALYQVPPKLSVRQQAEILNELKLTGPLCYDRNLFTPILSPEEIKKHNYYTSRLIEYREEYLDSILDQLTPDDVRCLIISEDERNRCDPLERIFPNADTYKFLVYVENPRYYNRLLDAWETKYLDDRDTGIELLQKLCSEGYHLKVPAAALIEEPKIDLTDIDLMYMKPEEIAKRRESVQSSNDKPSDNATTTTTTTTNEDSKNATTTTKSFNGSSSMPTSNCSAEIVDNSGDVHKNNARPIAVGS
ncbi:tubulin monoglutamylase TTLL4 isoform X2 [Episyrphus balteatus]|uniref:tubulin monoglutamylase TTLL4 isoform X2 n=1 Tax=Episyrphus balteatus TaxID=286459 RepID=UPI0024865F28|nr:tubulin monoglutamylase TTLL4 isoform X2 [Episyrphus balteatus]